jgi:hypothetical protein
MSSEVADGVALEERVEEVADLGRLPDEGPLDLGDGDLAGFDPSEDGLDGLRGDGVALGGRLRVQEWSDESEWSDEADSSD